MKTRSQGDLILAENLVSQLTTECSEVRNIYGSLCHSFPVLVRTCGLCQALAFHADKAASADNQPTNRSRAHRFLLEHVAQILQVEDAIDAVRGADIAEYVHYTRRILAAWIYFKRFAVSILKVESASSPEAR